MCYVYIYFTSSCFCCCNYSTKEQSKLLQYVSCDASSKQEKIEYEDIVDIVICI